MKNNKIENITLLYVEDEQTTRDIFEKFFKRIFKNVIVEENGEKGYEAFIGHQPDLIVTDIQMPVLNGLEMSKKIRDLNENIPIIFATSHNEKEYLHEAIEIGVNAFLLKPVNFIKLTHILNNVVNILIKKIDEVHKTQIEDKNKRVLALDRLIDNIAHQWRQPLSAITTASAIYINMQLERDDCNKRDIARKVKSVEKYALFLSKTIDSFRTFISREVSPKRFDIIKTIEKSLSIQNDILNSKLIKLIKHFSKLL